MAIFRNLVSTTGVVAVVMVVVLVCDVRSDGVVGGGGGVVVGGGAPLDVCMSVSPEHANGSPQSNSNTPYTVETSLQADGTSKVLVTIGSTSGATPFKGFSLQARSPGSNIPIGTWTAAGNAWKTTDCQGSIGSVLTHVDDREVQQFSATWTPPTNFAGIVDFYATVVQTFEIFWVGIPSNPVMIQKPNIAPNATTSPTQPQGPQPLPPPSSQPLPTLKQTPETFGTNKSGGAAPSFATEAQPHLAPLVRNATETTAGTRRQHNGCPKAASLMPLVVAPLLAQWMAA